MLSVTLPCILVELALDMALDDARASQVTHEDNTGETNPYVAKDILRLESIQHRLLESRDGKVTLDAHDITAISFFAREWKDDRGINRLTQDMIEH